MNQIRWYAAHLILYVEYKDHRQATFPVWENILLIEGCSEEEAFAKAEEQGRLQEGDSDGSFRWDGKPARWVFAGVRKLCLCVEAIKRPGDGTEITYTQMKVRSRDAITQLVRGEPVSVRYDEQFKE
jgi:hypothetical protein